MLSAALGLGACATAGGPPLPAHSMRVDPSASAMAENHDVYQCALLEQALDSKFRHAHARVHVAPGGVIETVAVRDRPYLSECLQRAFRTHKSDVEPNLPDEDYDVDISL